VQKQNNERQKNAKTIQQQHTAATSSSAARAMQAELTEKHQDRQ
jgi:hypothetical protein